MEKKIIQVNESEYNSILRQVVAVIENSKATIAKNINIGINTTHWNIGKLLHDKKLESKHGSGVVNRLSVDLKQMYPEMGVSPRNLWDMKKFYERFKESDEKLRHAVAVLPWSSIPDTDHLTISWLTCLVPWRHIASFRRNRAYHAKGLGTTN